MTPNGRRAWRRFAKQQRRKVNRRNRQTAPFARLLRVEKINDIRYSAAANHSSSNQTSRLRALR